MTAREAAFLLAVPLLAVLAASRYGTHLMTKDIEYWGGAVLSAEYNEPWNQKVKCVHEKPCVHRDKKGKKEHKNDGYLHEFDVKEHPATYHAYDTNKQKIVIDAAQFEKLCNQFGNKQFKNLFHRSYTRDGNRYVTKWGGQMSSLEPTTTVHEYENRLIGSHNVFGFDKVDPEEWGLFDYPAIESFYHADPILGANDPEASHRLDVLNAQLGPQKEVRAMILVFQGKPRDAAFAQEAYWQGGNKNEFVLCIGTDSSNRVQWAHVFSWTEEESLKIEARNEIMNQADQPLDLKPVVIWLVRNLPRFRRKEFSDFDYLYVQPPLWLVVTAHVITLIFTALWLWLAVARPNRK